MQITRANWEKAKGLKNKDNIEQEVSARRKSESMPNVFLFHEIIAKSFYLHGVYVNYAFIHANAKRISRIYRSALTHCTRYLLFYLQIINLKKVLKTQISDNDDSMQIDTRESSSLDLRRKPFKTKGSRLHHAPMGKLTGKAATSVDAGGNMVTGSAAAVENDGVGDRGGANVTVAAANASSITSTWLKAFTQSFDKE